MPTNCSIRHAFVALTVALVSACASNVPKPTFSNDVVKQYAINAADHAQVKVEAASDVKLEEFEKRRLSDEIASRLEERRAKNPAAAEGHSCNVIVTITRYERGNAFARAMLAGLGQIHIDGSVKVLADPSGEKLEDFKIAKTFAWGGIYGASTSMEDIERTFSDGVAAALTGQPAEEAKQKPTPTSTSNAVPAKSP